MRKVNTALFIVALCTSLFLGGVVIYTHVSDLQSSKVIEKLEG